MALFPAFIDLKGKEILVVGGGKVAAHKIAKIMPFEPQLTVVALKVNEEIRSYAQQFGFRIIERAFEVDDLKQKLMVIAAVDSLALQREIFDLCQERKILCNSVDSPSVCNFIFPSLVVKGDLSIGICTSGQAPAVSAVLRRYLEKMLPDHIHTIIGKIRAYRESLPKGAERQQKVVELTERLLDSYIIK